MNLVQSLHQSLNLFGCIQQQHDDDGSIRSSSRGNGKPKHGLESVKKREEEQELSEACVQLSLADIEPCLAPPPPKRRTTHADRTKHNFLTASCFACSACTRSSSGVCVCVSDFPKNIHRRYVVEKLLGLFLLKAGSVDVGLKQMIGMRDCLHYIQNRNILYAIIQVFEFGILLNYSDNMRCSKMIFKIT